MKWILASKSPRRKELLKLVVPEFEVTVSGAEEILEKEYTIEEQVMKLAYRKAKQVYDNTQGNRIIIGSDTIVTKNGKIYGKAKDKEHAKKMIKELLTGDRTHYVMTGLTVLVQDGEVYKENTTYDKVKIYLKEITDKEIDKWIEIGKATDRAGAYGIQDEFGVFVEKIEGNYTSVVGLPIHKVYDLVKEYLTKR